MTLSSAVKYQQLAGKKGMDTLPPPVMGTLSAVTKGTPGKGSSIRPGRLAPAGGNNYRLLEWMNRKYCSAVLYRINYGRLENASWKPLQLGKSNYLY